MDDKKYILDGTELVPVSLEEWAEWFESTERHLASTWIGRYWVSTVFLGIDHRFFGEGPPIVFESMIFKGGHHDINQTRYATWDEAMDGHDAMVENLIEKVSFKQLGIELAQAYSEDYPDNYFPVCRNLLMQQYNVPDSYRGGPIMDAYIKTLAFPVVAVMGCISVLYDKFMIRMKSHAYRVRPSKRARPEPQLAA